MFDEWNDDTAPPTSSPPYLPFRDPSSSTVKEGFSLEGGLHGTVHGGSGLGGGGGFDS